MHLIFFTITYDIQNKFSTIEKAFAKGEKIEFYYFLVLSIHSMEPLLFFDYNPYEDFLLAITFQYQTTSEI